MKSKKVSAKRYTKKRVSKRSSGFKSMVKSSKLFVLPPRMRTRQAMSMTATLGTGLMSVGGAYFVSYANAIYQPFNTASATIAGSFTLTQGSSITQSPVGYTILSSQYGRYKITNVRYELSLVCGSNQDTMAVYIYPFVWNTGTSGLNPFNAQSQPGCKYKVMNQSGASSTDNKIVASYDIRKYLGLSKTQFNAQTDATNAGQPTQLLGVNFGFEPLNATTNAQPVSFDVRAIYTVEWSQPIVLLN